MDRKIHIYGLRNEKSLEYRYIGKTSRPDKRLKEHLNEKIRKFSYYKLNWVQESIKNSEKIVLDIIDTVDEDIWQEKEKYYIDFYTKKGDRLTNLIDGGLTGHWITYKLNYDEAKNIVRTLNFKTTLEWRKKCKTNEIPNNIPRRPDLYYLNNGWVSWSDWLGVEVVSNKNKVFLSYDECKKIVHTLDLKTNLDWRKYCNSGNKPKNIPSNPDTTFKNKGWVSWFDWLNKK